MKTYALSYRARLVAVYCVTILALVLAITIALVSTSSRQAEKDSRSHLNLLTEQVLINFSNATKNAAQQLLTMLNGTGATEQMDRMRNRQENDGGYYQNTQDLVYAINQMITAKTYYSELYVRLDSGRSFSSTFAEAGFLKEADRLLTQSGYGENAYGAARWVRGEDGNVYLIRDAYHLSPFRHIGKIVALIRSDMLVSLGGYNNELNCSVLFLQQRQPIVQTGNDQADLTAAAAQAVSGAEVPGYTVSVQSLQGWTAVGMLPEASLRHVRRTIMESGALIALLAVIVGTLVVLAVTHRMTRQVRSLLRSMDEAAAGNMAVALPEESGDEFGQLAAHFNRMIAQTQELLARVVREEQDKSKAQYNMLEYKYRSLQSQINPHFIYNALETVNALAKLDGNREISEIVQHISAFFRQNTGNMQKKFVTVRQEFDSLKQYAYIYCHIHGDKLSTPITCSPDASDALIPTMILQPVLENALVHGLRPMSDKTLVMLSADDEGDRLVIEVRDNGSGMPAETIRQILTDEPTPQPASGRKSTGIGMRNVRERLSLIYGDRAWIAIESREGEGTQVSINIPLVYDEADLEESREG